jgi:CRISPR type I-E-associated protein CasB/Cse2
MVEETTSKVARFIGWVKARLAAGDRGTLADLRRGFSPGTEHRAWPHLAQWCNIANERERRVWTTVAAGVATLEGSDSGAGDMGATLRRIALQGASGSVQDALSTFDARFRRLLTCHTAEELCSHLPGIIRAARQKGVCIDFERLFWDLMTWHKEPPEVRTAVRVRWAASYWSGERTEQQEQEGGEAA